MDRILSVLSFGTNSLIIAKLVLAALLLVSVFAASNMVVSTITGYISAMEDGELMGYDFPLVSMLAYVGFFDGLSIILGAWGAVLLIRTAYRVLGWF